VSSLITREKFAYTLFLRLKPVRMLTMLREGPKYATILSKNIDITYSHTVKLLDLFNDLGLVEFEKRGRIKIVKLTSVGEDVARALDNVLSKISQVKVKTYPKR
jgi:DNA-binding transcriptional ArsR family regulator